MNGVSRASTAARWARALGRAVALLLLIGLPLAPGAQAARGEASAANAEAELVYLDPGGVIRVLDPQTPAGNPQVMWASPTGGWQHLALGDFNADGDMEIVAVGGVEGAYRLAVFDPVAEGVSAKGADGVINGIPWVQLYSVALHGEPIIVGAGNFALDRPADEIVVCYRLPLKEIISPDDTLRYVILAAEGDPPDGRKWSTRLTYETGSVVTWLGAGNINGSGPDEIVVIHRVGGSLRVYDIAHGFFDLIKESSAGWFKWVDGAIGQFVQGGDEELAAARETVKDTPSLYVLQYADGNWTDAYAEYNDPPPYAVWFADISGNQDDEVVVLRLVPVELGARPRLFVRDNGNDTIGLGEPALDTDNGYRAGAGGDFDGDGRDEIAVMRDDRIRIFTQPEKSDAKTDYDVATNSRLIVAGNLDANGLAGASRLVASPSNISDSLITGEAGATHSVSLADPVNGRALPFTVSVEKGSTWVKVTASSAQTPATLSVVFDAGGLAAGAYTDRLLIDSSDESVVNTPIAVDLSLEVRAGLLLRPSSIIVAQEDCSPQAAPVDIAVEIVGTQGLNYTLQLSGSPNWVSVNPRVGATPGTAVVTVLPAAVGSGVASTELVASGTISATQVTARAPVVMLCVTSRIYLPLMTR